jgi:uncharacterized protein (TIGR02145 family)
MSIGTGTITTNTANATIVDDEFGMTSVSMSSNNANDGEQYAKAEDVITLVFQTNKDVDVNDPIVLIQSKTATVSRISPTSFSATYTVQSGDTNGAVSISISSYTSAVGSIVGDTVTATTDSSALILDTVAPTIIDNFTTQNENDNDLNDGGVSMDASDVLSGLLANSYSKTADVNVDNAAITVGVSDGLVNFASGFYPDYETKQTLTFELQVSDKAGNIGTQTVDLIIVGLTETAIVDAIYVANDERNSGNDSFYIIFSEDVTITDPTDTNLTSYYTGTFVASNPLTLSSGVYTQGTTTGWAHRFDVTAGTITTTVNNGLDIKIATSDGSSNPASALITPASGSNLVEVGFSEEVFGTESFDDYGNTYTAVVSPHSLRVWHSKNLGAAQVATAYNDASSYGSYFQWGRGADGHQINADATPSNGDSSDGGNTTTKATSTVAVDNKFITTTNDPRDWVEGSVNNSDAIRSANWSKTDGNSICPIGYRVPTGTELNTDIILDGQDWSTGDRREAAMNNFLKLPTAGNRVNSDGLLNSLSSYGLYWGSSIGNDSRPNRLIFNQNSIATVNTNHRSNGYSVRCIKD